MHKLPVDLREALIANSTALAAWRDITPLARNESPPQRILRAHADV